MPKAEVLKVAHEPVEEVFGHAALSELVRIDLGSGHEEPCQARDEEHDAQLPVPLEQARGGDDRVVGKNPSSRGPGLPRPVSAGTSLGAPSDCDEEGETDDRWDHDCRAR